MEFNLSVFIAFCKNCLASLKSKCPIINIPVKEDSFVSVSEDFLPYDENVEPITTEPEAAEYQGQVHGPR